MTVLIDYKHDGTSITGEYYASQDERWESFIGRFLYALTMLPGKNSPKGFLGTMQVRRLICKCITLAIFEEKKRTYL